MVLLRRILGDTLRAQRLAQQRTLREVSTAAKVSLGYLSEVERGQKEASSELLSSICEALGVPLSEVLRDVSDTLEVAETTPAASASVLNAVEPVAALSGSALGGDGAELEVVGAGVGGNGPSRLEVHLDHHLDSHLDARGRHRVVAAA
ncbi:helix-turn-helix domain-containing protein [Cryptosporangium aurantiacum]|uniref:Transcriptional regulator, contains XRE-family HTH domain n=1 Tax=Cryptosporangium aurantiacum TaxID=134849 RepID=A0A1M7ISZ6_9ACTN|nr:helix-turn-helix transcriptional regulator [Cryptosporangium aurantiacum]SHM43841.1 Transcriptional regulator, contains XRE-family HTH domain [Cryptosporangium aurantiacum]